MKFIDLPQRTRPAVRAGAVELRARGPGDARGATGWQVRHALDFSTDPDAYRDYIAGSRGEFTVAKDQNVRLRTGWFSDRSAPTWPPGRPVISQDTGLQQRVPDRRGAVRRSRRWTRSSPRSRRSTPTTSATRRAAEEIAREYFAHDVVLGPPARRTSASSSAAAAGTRCSSHGTAPFPRGPRPHAGLAPSDAAAAPETRGARSPPRPCPSGTCSRGPLHAGQHRDRHPRQPALHPHVRWRACSPAPSTRTTR